jgi:hypothetical protein
MSPENNNDPIENPIDPTQPVARPPRPAPAPKKPAPKAVAAEPKPELDEDPVDESDSDEPEERKKGGVLLNRLLLIGGVLLIAVGAVLGVMQLIGGPSGEFTDMDGNIVEPDSPTPNDEEWLKQIDLQEISGARFIVDSVGLNVPYGEVNEVNGVLNPPNFRGVFRVRNRGVDLAKASEGTVYLVTHSLRNGGHSPGNYLMDIWTNKWSLAPGDVISVNGVRYVADSYMLVDNENLGSRPELWSDEPGRLVLITCMQYPDKSPTRENLVIIAHLEGFTAKPSPTQTSQTTSAINTQAPTLPPSTQVPPPTTSTETTTTETTTTEPPEPTETA